MNTHYRSNIAFFISAIKKILKGHFTKKTLKLYLMIHSIIVVSLLVISRLLVKSEVHYSIMRNFISHLGVDTINPIGYIFFSICFIVLGLGYIPLILYIHRRITVPRSKWFALVGTFFWAMAIIGIVGIAVFPDKVIITENGINIQIIHHIVAYDAVVGFIGGLVCYSEVIIEDYIAQRRGKEGFFNINKLGPPILIFFILMIGLTITQVYASNNLELPYPGIFSRTLWEWMIFITSFYEVYSFVLFMPEYVPVEIDYKKYIYGLIKKDPEIRKKAIKYNPYLNYIKDFNKPQI